MTRAYRKFSVAASIAIVARAQDGAGRVHCERCGRWCPKRKDYEIDHVLAEGMRPSADLQRPLVAAEGQLLCLDCHARKTDKDKAEIALAKRREAYDQGIERPDKKKLSARRKKDRPPYRPAAGEPQLMRQGFAPAGDSKCTC